MGQFVNAVIRCSQAVTTGAEMGAPAGFAKERTVARPFARLLGMGKVTGQTGHTAIFQGHFRRQRHLGNDIQGMGEGIIPVTVTPHAGGADNRSDTRRVGAIL